MIIYDPNVICELNEIYSKNYLDFNSIYFNSLILNL